MAPVQLAGLVLGDSPAERIIPGLQVTFVGMGVVFAVLILLFVILTLVGKFGGEAASPSAPAAVMPSLAAAVPPPPAAVAAADQMGALPEGLSQAASQERGHEQLVAVLAAAIAAATATGSGLAAAPSPWRRKGNQPGWALAGRIALHTGRETLPRG